MQNLFPTVQPQVALNRILAHLKADFGLGKHSSLARLAVAARERALAEAAHGDDVPRLHGGVAAQAFVVVKAHGAGLNEPRALGAGH